MNQSPVDRRIADLLDDPLVSLMIQADKVDRIALASTLRTLRPWGHASAGGASRALLSQPKVLRSPSAAALAPAHFAAGARAIATSLCWSCAK
jgi:hypothetical protein